ncbi:MAG: class I SAM-dependent methyltransferase [Myxococcales bacterium]|nr:class I SAM-dependent methyltransferase [Myxococcales bacterium]MCB9709016.1 class I SAM-dependent methyltransferase [Myxococcales bacterium]
MLLVADEIERYCHAHTSGESALLQEVAAYTKSQRSDAGMLTGKTEGQLLKLLAQLSGARRVLEIGTFTGYSGLSFAEGLPADGHIVTCELNPANAAIAQGFFDRSPHGKKIEVKVGPALDTLASLTPGFDLAFLDADKENYPRYYEASLALVRQGGLVIIDNSLWSGAVLEPTTPEATAIATLNDRILKDNRVDNVLLTVRDGVNLVRKR